MIHGVGIDVEMIERVEQLVAEHEGRVGEVFTKRELEDAERFSPKRRARFYAEAFAGKEAVMKSLGTGWTENVRWVEIETRSENSTSAKLSGTTAKVAETLGVSVIFISLAATRKSVMAIAVAEKADQNKIFSK